MDDKVREAMIGYVKCKFGADLEGASSEEFEKYKSALSEHFKGRSDEQVAEYFDNEVATDKRLKEQLYMRLSCWAGLNVYFFWNFGFSAALTVAGLVWLAGGTVFILTVWSLVASHLERAWLTRGGNTNVWRVIEYVLMFFIARNILLTNLM